jgi:hypothetical protein
VVLKPGYSGIHLGLRGARGRGLEENVLFTKYFSSDEIKKNYMGGHVPCNGEIRGVYRDFWVNMKERNYSEDLGVSRVIALQWIFKKDYGCVNWINLVQSRDR